MVSRDLLRPLLGNKSQEMQERNKIEWQQRNFDIDYGYNYRAFDEFRNSGIFINNNNNDITTLRFLIELYENKCLNNDIKKFTNKYAGQ